MRKDPDMMNNLAGNTDWAKEKNKLADQLMKELTRAKDPRVTETPPRFEQPPFTDAGDGGGRGKKPAPPK